MKCQRMNHFARVCKSGKKVTFGQVSSADESDSEESSGRIVVGHLEDTQKLAASVKIKGSEESKFQSVSLTTDTGISKTLLNANDWLKIKDGCIFIKTSKKFRPYGTSYHLPIKGKAKVLVQAENGAQITTWVYVVNDTKEQSLLGKEDALRLGIVTLNLKGAEEEIVGNISYHLKDKITVSKDQEEVQAKMEAIVKQFPEVFSDKTGKFKGDPIKIHVKPNAMPVIQPPRRIPLHYREKAKKEIMKMIEDDVLEGPIEVEEPGTFLSNLVITDKKGTDCQAVNKEIYPTHELIPTVEELRHELQNCNRFSTLDMTNCYYQFEIEDNARKLFAFRTPWGIFRYKRMVMGTNTACSEIQKRIREAIKECSNAIQIKDDILIYGHDDEHDQHLINILTILKKKGITVRPGKCDLGKPEVKWFGCIFSADGMSPDPEKCDVIKSWPAPQSSADVKSFLQTVQFHAKFLGKEAEGMSYPELTAPLRALTKKYARFRWSHRESEAFEELKKRMCSDKVVAPYDITKPTRMYVDSSPIGTEAMIAQPYLIDGNEVWRPVNHSSRAWTPAEANYSQIERESNGILTGMCMNKMYTLGKQVEVITDHEPLIHIYTSPAQPKQHRVDRHRTKLLPYTYTVKYQPGSKTPCDYGSRHPPMKTNFTQKEIGDWEIETGTDVFVNRIIEENIPQAMTIEMVHQESLKDSVIQELIQAIVSNKRCQHVKLKEYKEIFHELWTIEGILLKGNQIVLPNSLQTDSIGLAHEGHQYTDKTLNLLRQTCWFPKMRRKVEEYVQSCLACNAAISSVTPVPLEPNLLPDRPWQKLHADFKGPIDSKCYLDVVIDQYSKFPEVDIVSSTSFEKLRPVLDRIFSTHGIPETVSADNGPPYFSHDLKMYAEEMGFKLTPVSPEDPQANGFAENFVKILCKLIHTASVEGKDPRAELYKYLLHYRATPHCTTEKSPSEMLFGRRIKTKLPRMFQNDESNETRAVRALHDGKKMKQKQYFDKRRRAKAKDINVGDQVLIRQKNNTIKPPFNPTPLRVTKTKGNRVWAQNKLHGVRIRDKNHLKKVVPRPLELIPSWETVKTSQPDYSHFEIEGTLHNQTDIDKENGNNTEPYEDNVEMSMEDRLATLLQAAEERQMQETTGPVTRSQGSRLKWNPEMNAGDVIINDE